MLEAEEGGEDEAAGEEGRPGAGEDEGEEQDAVEEAVVLEVDVVDYEEARGEEDGDCGGVGGALVFGCRVDESESVRTGCVAANRVAGETREGTGGTHSWSAYASSSSVTMTEARWKYTVCQLSYSRL